MSAERVSWRDPASGGWDAAAAVAAARAVAAGDPSARGRLLGSHRRGSVVWLDAAGPAGEAVIVKAIAVRGGPRRAWARLVRSPAEAQRRAALALRAAGVGTPDPLAVVEHHGASTASCLVTRALPEARPLDEFVPLLGARDRRRFARDLGVFLATLHRGPVHVADLRDRNLLATRRGAGFAFVLVDLDRARPLHGPIPWLLRRANLVQLDRTLGWLATERERLAALAAYRQALPGPHPRFSAMAAEIERRKRRKDRAVARRRERSGIVAAERQRLAAIIVTGNEIGHISGCLDSVAFADEIVVVDSYSTDGTFDACEGRATRLLRRGWTGYRDQKAFALAHATCPWVLNVDADERVSPELREEIEAILRSDGRGYDGFAIPRLVWYLGRWWRYGGWYPDRRLRLFRRERATWGGTDPHEHVRLRGRVGRVEAPLWHYTYDDVSDHVATIDRFTTIASRSGRPARRRSSWAALVLRPAARFVRFYLLRGGIRMGFPGLFAAISAALYVHLKYAKRDEVTRGRAGAA